MWHAPAPVQGHLPGGTCCAAAAHVPRMAVCCMPLFLCPVLPLSEQAMESSLRLLAAKGALAQAFAPFLTPCRRRWAWLTGCDATWLPHG